MSSIPYLICWILLICSSFLADYIVTKKVLKILTVRKIFTTLSKNFIYFKIVIYKNLKFYLNKKKFKRHALARHSTYSTYFHRLLKALLGRVPIDAWLFVQVNIYYFVYTNRCGTEQGNYVYLRNFTVPFHPCLQTQMSITFTIHYLFTKWLSWQWWFLCKFV